MIIAMESKDQTSSLNQYFLQIKALTPAQAAEGNAVAPDDQPAPSPDYAQHISTSLIIFISMIIIGTLGLLITRARELNKLIAVLVLSLITSAIPLALNLTKEPASLRSQAGPEIVPKEVVVNQVTSTSFEISWYTDKAQASIAKISISPDMSQKPRLISSPEDRQQNYHSLMIDQLDPATTYYLEVLSGAEWYNHNGRPLEIITTAR